MDIAFNFEFKGFDGCPIALLEQLENNITSAKDTVLRGIFDQSSFSLLMSQSDETAFRIHVVICEQNNSSEDVVIGQVESNIQSLQRKGLLSLGLHEWELSIKAL